MIGKRNVRNRKVKKCPLIYNETIIYRGQGKIIEEYLKKLLNSIIKIASIVF